MPCNSRSVIRTKYAAEHVDKMLEAARRLGWAARQRGDGSIQVETRDGIIVVRPGSTEASRSAQGQADASALMVEYARVQFDEWAGASPDTYEEVERTAASVTMNIKAR